MNETNTIIMEDEDIITSYEEFAGNIATILERWYHLTAEQADEAVRMADLRPVFEFDPEMVLHTAYESWAEDVLDYWKEQQA